MEYRTLSKQETALLKEIDRAEMVKKMYKMLDGELVLEDVFFDIKGWHPPEVDEYVRVLNQIYDRGGVIYGAFEGSTICGIAALDSHIYGERYRYIKLDKLYISKTHRGKGIGRELVRLMSEKARDMGAQKLYVSATPFENTVNFYKNVGCTLAEEYIKELHDLEPEDIHMELVL